MAYCAKETREMIDGLEPYPAYKDSGVPWLGEVPEHWDVRKLRNLLEVATERNRPDLPLLSVVREKGVIQRDTTSKDENRNFIPDDLSNYKVVRVGQLAMNKMKAWQGSYGVSQHDGIVSPAYFVFDVSDVEGTFFHSAIRSRAYVPFFAQASDGVRIGQWDLSQARMKEIPFSVPPLHEQAAIVRFLDHADRRIRRYIRAKQKVIKLLEEQKQAIIHRAVTRGLDPRVRLKPSGVGWLGDVPEHWEVKKLKHLSRQIVDGTHFTPSYVDDGVPFVRVTDIQSESLRMESLRRISEEEHSFLNKRCNPERGDLLLSKNGTIGLTKVVDWDFPFSIFVSLCLIKPIAAMVDAHFVSFAFRGGLLVRQLSEITKTTSVTNLHLEKIRDLIIPVPPLDEQRRIMAATSEGLRALDRTLNTFHREISLLREYRTRLIADVVTGKIDVRAAAARLPQETEEAELLGDADALSDSEEETADDLDAVPEEAEA